MFVRLKLAADMDAKQKAHAHSEENYLLLSILCQMQLFSKSFAEMVLIEREETKDGGKGMARGGGGDRLGGTEMMDGVSEREP